MFLSWREWRNENSNRAFVMMENKFKEQEKKARKEEKECGTPPLNEARREGGFKNRVK